mmetsp:Transcript_49159/g.92168  ORF Transcript_49159/g.92168 Transcript_49159/m.92168 type:complete len:116 (+) Transcript_49159:85-432(+)
MRVLHIKNLYSTSLYSVFRLKPNNALYLLRLVPSSWYWSECTGRWSEVPPKKKPTVLKGSVKQDGAMPRVTATNPSIAAKAAVVAKAPKQTKNKTGTYPNALKWNEIHKEIKAAL